MKQVLKNHVAFLLDVSWDVYVQSTSVNRNIIPKQRVLVLK